MWTVVALLSLPLSGIEMTFAPPAPSASPSFQGRLEAAARALQNNPRPKNLSEQQRINRVEFVVGNTLVLLLHEMDTSISRKYTCLRSGGKRTQPTLSPPCDCSK